MFSLGFNLYRLNATKPFKMTVTSEVIAYIKLFCKVLISQSALHFTLMAKAAVKVANLLVRSHRYSVSHPMRPTICPCSAIHTPSTFKLVDDLL